MTFNHYLFIFFKAHKLLISSEGAGREVHEESLGVYVLTGEISNDRPIYKNTKDNDRYLHFSPNSTWTVSKNDKKCHIYNSISITTF